MKHYIPYIIPQWNRYRGPCCFYVEYKESLDAFHKKFSSKLPLMFRTKYIKKYMINFTYYVALFSKKRLIVSWWFEDRSPPYDIILKTSPHLRRCLETLIIWIILAAYTKRVLHVAFGVPFNLFEHSSRKIKRGSDCFGNGNVVVAYFVISYEWKNTNEQRNAALVFACS